MTPAKAQSLLLTAGLVAAGAAVFYVWRRGIGGVAQDATQGAVEAVTGAAQGAVIGLGEAVGIPPTDAAQCAAAKAEGRKLDASRYCSAGDFAAWAWSGFPTAGNLSNSTGLPPGAMN